jgi:hypothetical protein
MKPTKEQIEAALAYADEKETDNQLRALAKFHNSTLASANATAILAAAYRDLLNRPHEIICTKCGLREERGEKPNADF